MRRLRSATPEALTKEASKSQPIKLPKAAKSFECRGPVDQFFGHHHGWNIIVTPTVLWMINYSWNKIRRFVQKRNKNIYVDWRRLALALPAFPKKIP